MRLRRARTRPTVRACFPPSRLRLIRRRRIEVQVKLGTLLHLIRLVVVLGLRAAAVLLLL